jgi:hypothetical protein
MSHLTIQRVINIHLSISLNTSLISARKKESSRSYLVLTTCVDEPCLLSILKCSKQSDSRIIVEIIPIDKYKDNIICMC